MDGGRTSGGSGGDATSGRRGVATVVLASRRRQAARGLVSGLVGGFCCLAGAIAVGLGLGGASFFGTLMDRYQADFMLASLGVMSLWVARTIRRSEVSNSRPRTLLRAVARPLTVMGIAYAATLVVALGAARLAGLS